jgi:hypothetical protein
MGCFLRRVNKKERAAMGATRNSEGVAIRIILSLRLPGARCGQFVSCAVLGPAAIIFNLPYLLGSLYKVQEHSDADLRQIPGKEQALI